VVVVMRMVVARMRELALNYRAHAEAYRSMDRPDAQTRMNVLLAVAHEIEAVMSNVHCVNHDHAELQGTSWCGRPLMSEWWFMGVDHAAENGRQAGRMVACPECVEAILTALRNGHEES
jgi:hypothetical protein